MMDMGEMSSAHAPQTEYQPQRPAKTSENPKAQRRYQIAPRTAPCTPR